MNWLKEIEDASTPVSVLVVVNEYLDAATDDFRRRVPPALMPAPLKSVLEIHDWQRRLTAAVIDNPVKAPPALLDLSYVMLRAAARALELEALPPPANDPDTWVAKG